jgi:hypothetical protein
MPTAPPYVTVAALQMRCRVLQRPEHAVEVDVQDSLERRVLGLANRPVGDDTGVRNDEVD